MAFLELVKTIGAAFGTLVKPFGGIDNVGNARAVKVATTGEVHSLLVGSDITTPTTQRLLTANSNGSLLTINQDYLWAVTNGDIPNRTKVIQSANITTNNATEVYFSKSATTVYRHGTTGVQHYVSSTANESTGITKVKIDYIDSVTGLAGTAEATLSTGTRVAIGPATVKNINNFYASAPLNTYIGTSGIPISAIGTITLHNAATGGNTVTYISPGDTRAQLVHYYVPADKTLYVTSIKINAVRNNTVIFIYKTNELTNVYEDLAQFVVSTTTISPFTNTVLKVPGNGKIALAYTATNANDALSAILEGWLQ